VGPRAGLNAVKKGACAVNQTPPNSLAPQPYPVISYYLRVKTKLCTLSTQRVCVFYIVLKVNSNYFLTLNKLIFVMKKQCEFCEVDSKLLILFRKSLCLNGFYDVSS
jgi:vesicle coat complex subunit